MNPMKRILFLTILIPVVAPAQTLDAYLSLRKKHGITQAVGVQALETLIGNRVCEVKGVVKGVMRGPRKTMLLLEKTNGDYLSVSCAKSPEWLESNEVPVRLLVEARRPEETGETEASLIGAAPESKIAAIEREELRKALAAAAKAPKEVKPPRVAREWNLPPSSAVPIYAGFIKQRNKRLSDSQAAQIAEGVVGFSLKYGVDARLIMAMLMVESNFNPNAVSRSGAMGLGQLMPGTARGMGVSNAFDTHENLYGTVRLIRGHMDKYQKQTGDAFESLVLALAAYNAGSGAVRKHGGVPPYRETQAYVRKVTSLYYQLCGQR